MDYTDAFYKNSDMVITAGPRAAKMGYNLETLDNSNLLNAASLDIIKKRTMNNHIYQPCIAMRDSGELHQEMSQVAIWKGPSEVRALN